MDATSVNTSPDSDVDQVRRRSTSSHGCPRLHVELTREIARGSNDRFAPLFPVPVGLTPDAGPRPGTDGSPKMSRSIGNTINLFDDAARVRAKVMSMYTDPTRLRPTDPGHVEGSPVFASHDAFDPDPGEVANLKARYVAGRVGDVEVKERWIAVLNAFLHPIRQPRRDLLAENPSIVEEVLRSGTARAGNERAETLRQVRTAMQIDYFA